MNSSPKTKPITGEATSGMSTFVMTPSICQELMPAEISDAPSSPPMSAWLDDDGMPSRQVIRFQMIAPTRAAAMTVWDSTLGSMIPPLIVSATFVPDERSGEVGGGAHRDRPARSQRARTDRCRDRVGGVVEAVDVIEGDREPDDDDAGSALRHQACLTTMRSITFATSSQESIVSSRMRVHVLPLDDVDRIGAVREEVGDRAASDAIALVLEPMDLDPMRQRRP